MTDRGSPPILLAIAFYALILHSGNTCYINEHGNFNGTELRMIGKQKTFPYTKFLGIDPGERKCLKTLHLELVEFEPDYLVDQLEGCENLQNLELRNTHLKGKRFTKKVHLRNLLNFKLYLKNWDFKASSVEEILSFYFVYKHPIQEYIDNYYSEQYNDKPRPFQNYSLTEFLPSFNFDSRIYLVTSVGERDILIHNIDSLSINDLPFDISSYFEFFELYLYNTALNLSNVKEIQHLYSDNVKRISGRISDVVAKSPNANFLIFGLSKSAKHESIDLAELPSKLTTFGISYCSIWNSIPNLHLTSLNYLNLKHCELNLTLMPKFEKLSILYLTNVSSVEGTNMISFIKENEQLNSVVLDGLNTFDLSALERSRGSLSYLAIRNTPVTQSVETSLCVKHSSKRFYNLILKNSVPDAAALTRFPETFTCLESLEIYGDFEYLSSLLLVAVQTRVEKISIRLRGDQRFRSRPEFEKTVEFLKNLSVPPYATFINLVRNNSLPELWSYSVFEYDYYRENPYLRDLAIYSYLIPLLLICIIGILGNLVSGVVLMSKEIRGSNSYILLGLTVCDAMVLMTYISSLHYFGLKFNFMFWQFTIPEYQFPLFWFEISLASAQQSDNLQTLYLYPLNKTAYTGSVYMTVLVTLERYVAICWPLRSKRILTTKKAVVALVSVLGLSIILNIPRWLETQTNTVEEVHYYGRILWKLNRNPDSTDLLLYTAYREFYHGWIWVTLMYGIPIPLLIGLNLKIWIQLKERMANKEALRSSRDERGGEELASLTKTLICISTIFIICNIVNGVVTLLILLYNPGDWEPADIEIFSCIPLIVNSSVNFVIYCTMGTKFRRVLLNLLRRYCRVCGNPTIANTAIEMRNQQSISCNTSI